MAEIKFTDEEMKSLNEIQTQYRNLQMSMGALKLQQIAHEKQHETLEQAETDMLLKLSEMQNSEADLAKTLNDKYGQGSLDPATGVFTPNEVQPVAADDKPADD